MCQRNLVAPPPHCTCPDPLSRKPRCLDPTNLVPAPDVKSLNPSRSCAPVYGTARSAGAVIGVRPAADPRRTAPPPYPDPVIHPRRAHLLLRPFGGRNSQDWLRRDREPHRSSGPLLSEGFSHRSVGPLNPLRQSPATRGASPFPSKPQGGVRGRHADVTALTVLLTPPQMRSRGRTALG
jgi:hypothetical protein